MYRALIEATAFGTRVIIDAFEATACRSTRVVACGGLPQRNRLLMQIYADVTNREIKVAASKQTPALGAAMFGAVAAGPAAGGHATIAAAVPPDGTAERARLPSPTGASGCVRRALYGEYVRLHDLFGRGGDDVMRRLKGLRSAGAGSTPSEARGDFLCWCAAIQTCRRVVEEAMRTFGRVEALVDAASSSGSTTSSYRSRRRRVSASRDRARPPSRYERGTATSPLSSSCNSSTSAATLRRQPVVQSRITARRRPSRRSPGDRALAPHFPGQDVLVESHLQVERRRIGEQITMARFSLVCVIAGRRRAVRASCGSRSRSPW